MGLVLGDQRRRPAWRRKILQSQLSLLGLQSLCFLQRWKSQTNISGSLSFIVGLRWGEKVPRPLVFSVQKSLVRTSGRNQALWIRASLGIQTTIERSTGTSKDLIALPNRGDNNKQAYYLFAEHGPWKDTDSATKKNKPPNQQLNPQLCKQPNH